MDNAIHVQEEKKKMDTMDYAEQHRHIIADIHDATRMLESFKGLAENVDWENYHLMLIEPTKEKVKKEIERLNNSLKDNPNAMGQLIYQNAFYDVLNTITDLPALRKKWSEEFRRLEARKKEIEQKIKHA